MSPLAPSPARAAAERLSESERERRFLELRIVGAMAGGGLLLVSAVYRRLSPGGLQIGEAVAAIGALCVGAPVFVVALKGFLQREPTEVTEQLAALAILAALATQRYAVATLVPLFMLVGHVLEERSILGARAAIDGLRKLTARKAVRLVDAQEQEIDVERLEVGDVLLVRPGDAFAADGTVRQGHSWVNQAMVTGESVPLDVAPGDTVYAGTLNLSGVLQVETTHVGSGTAIGRVVELLREAEGSKSPLVRLMDNYASHYLPLIVALAGAVLFLTGDVTRAITVLVVSCPCAFVLSSPSAMIAALAVASRVGILIKNTSFLEHLGDVDTLVLDKTGTLTLGEIDVRRLRPEEGVSERELLEAAGAAGTASRHPVSRAIRREAEARGVQPPTASEVEEVAGKGLIVRTPGREVRIGRCEWLRECGLDVPGCEDNQMATTAWVAADGRLLGVILMSDHVRPEVKTALAELRTLGLERLIMLTGDRGDVARRVAAELGIEDVIPECLPEQKLQTVDSERREGRTVMVVGDGLNDAPALAEADVGVALGAMGCDVAIRSADVALMHNDLRRLATAIVLSRSTRRTIAVNLVVGAGFSVLMLALAALGIIGPVAGAVLHNVGAVFVVLNSALLLRFKEGSTTA